MGTDIRIDDALNDFAIRCFRDEGDADYISARMAFRTALDGPALWASQQTLEKYLKCILLLNRIKATRVYHDLDKALETIASHASFPLDLTPATTRFIEHVDALGKFRYLEVSRVASGRDIVSLDRAVWELRRYCTLIESPRLIKLQKDMPIPRVRIPGGDLERIIDELKNPAREPLLWRNLFFGVRARRQVRVSGWMKAKNSPLYVTPEVLDEVLTYVHIPKDVVAAYRAQKRAD
ncbi:MAG: hypothetical protein ABSD64_10175 [Terriglobales bacterium]|jgi:hypothetical protein